MHEFAIFAVIGFLAQLIDGSLGMGYGVVSSAALLTAGVPPAHASASVHAAKLFTSATSALSHFAHGNVDRRLFRQLAIAGSLGGMAGALMVTAVPGSLIRPAILAYLCGVGLLIVYRAWFGTTPGIRLRRAPPPAAIGGAGGFVDGIGGGGWGPVVTSSLIGAGGDPRLTVGSVNAAEFLVTAAVIAAFAAAGLSGFWAGAGSLATHAWAVAGLVAGGVPAAVIAGYLPKLIDARRLAGMVGVLVVALATQQMWQLLN